MIIAIIGSRRMDKYGERVIGLLLKYLANKDVKIATIEVGGCNQEVIRLTNNQRLIIINEKSFEISNRKLAKIADKLIIIEGGERSGTILVAKEFLDIGKEIWCVPGEIDNPNSYTTNYLIKMGAGVLTDFGDVA